MPALRHRSLAFILAASVLLTVSVPATAQLSGQASAKPVAEPQATFGPFEEWVASVAISPDGEYVVTGTYDEIQVSKLGSPKPIHVVKHKLGRVRSLAFSPDGKQLFAGGFRKIAVLDASSWNVEKELNGHRAYVTDLSISPDGMTLATSSEDATLRLWNLSDGTSRVLFQEQEDPITGVAFSPDGSQLAVASGDDTRPTRPGHIRLLDALSGKVVHELTMHDRAATAVAFSPDGKLIASTGLDEKVNLHEAETGKLVRKYDGHSRPTNKVRFLP